ncbi:UNVERIFIED_CONTAM: hypothetical protein NCL1_14665 [Trichonephila clavipes]
MPVRDEGTLNIRRIEISWRFLVGKDRWETLRSIEATLPNSSNQLHHNYTLNFTDAFLKIITQYLIIFVANLHPESKIHNLILVQVTQGFLASFECIKTILNLTSGVCQNNAFSSLKTLKITPGSTVFGINERMESLKTYEMECYGRQTMDACGTESHTTYKEISMRSSYYSADCKDYQHYFKSLEAMITSD